MQYQYVINFIFQDYLKNFVVIVQKSINPQINFIHFHCLHFTGI